MTEIERCRMELHFADNALKRAQSHAPKRHTNRVQVERRIVGIREKVAALLKLLQDV